MHVFARAREAPVILGLPRLQVATFSGPLSWGHGGQGPASCPSLHLLLLSQAIQLGRWPSPSTTESTRLALCSYYLELVSDRY